MLRLWPPTSRGGDHGEHLPDEAISAGLSQSAGLVRQSIYLESQPGGWLITVDSAIESGKVELFIPQHREDPVRIVTDSRASSQNLPFAELFSAGHYSEAAAFAEQDLQSIRESAASPVGLAPDDTGENSVDPNGTCTTRRPVFQTGSPPGEKIIGPDGLALVDALRNVAMASVRNGCYERAEAALNEAIAICEAAPAQCPQGLVRLLHDRAYTRYLFRCTDEAATLDVRRELARARERSEQLLGRDHPETARCMTSQARLLISEFSFPEAEDLLIEALRIRMEKLGAGHVDVSESLLELARLNAFREDDDEADEGFQRALAIREAQCGPHHPDVADVLFQYTDFLMYNRRDGAKAGPYLRRALAIWEETIGLDHSLVTRESEFIRKVLAVDANVGT